jgi:transposase-like protein
MDVTVLEAVFNKLNSYTTPSTNYAVKNGDDKFCCPECTNYNVRHNKQVVTAAGTIHYWMRCNDCRKHFKINNKTYIEFLKFKINTKFTLVPCVESSYQSSLADSCFFLLLITLNILYK